MDSVPEESRSATRLRERYGLLLLAIVATFAIQGIATPGKVEQILVTALLGATVLLALWATEAPPRLRRPALVFVVLVTISSVVQALAGEIDGAATRAANALLVSLAPPAIVIGIVRDVRARNAVTIQAVLGVLCVYLLIGMFFAFVFGILGRAAPPFFAGGQAASVASCLYYSFTTLATVGYGDLTARSNLGHTLSVSEALLGQIYLVTVVSLLVANLRRVQPPGPEPGTPPPAP